MKDDKKKSSFPWSKFFQNWAKIIRETPEKDRPLMFLLGWYGALFGHEEPTKKEDDK